MYIFTHTHTRRHARARPQACRHPEREGGDEGGTRGAGERAPGRHSALTCSVHHDRVVTQGGARGQAAKTNAVRRVRHDLPRLVQYLPLCRERRAWPPIPPPSCTPCPTCGCLTHVTRACVLCNQGRARCEGGLPAQPRHDSVASVYSTNVTHVTL